MLDVTPRWQAAELPSSLHQMPLALAKIYAGRGVRAETELDLSISNLLKVSELTGVERACQRINQAIDNQEQILIVGDFDCDGATSTALMMRILHQMGAKVDFIVPDRFKYGYGLTPEIVQFGIDTVNPVLIITVDNGISSHEGVAAANAADVEVIITDHHLTTKPSPPAYAVVNPNQTGCDFDSKALVGVGVAFYVLAALAKQRRLQAKSSVQVTQYLDLVALGTIADVGVLDQNNRILVNLGLQQIKQGNACYGIQALLQIAGRTAHQLSARDLGFVLGPRINAAGRMDNMRIGIECLLANDIETAMTLASELDSLNKSRRQVEQTMREQAEQVLSTLDAINHTTHQATESDRHRGIVLFNPEWHQGVIGIVAGRLKERYYQPAVVFAPSTTGDTSSNAMLKGSARSIEAIHIRDVIEQVAERHPNIISHFGGHAMAAGLSLTADKLEQFTNAFQAVLSEYEASAFCETLYTDGELTATEMTLDFAEYLKSANIWGNGFVMPQFDGVFRVEEARILKESHLKLRLHMPDLGHDLDAIWFRYDKSAWRQDAQHVHILYELDINEFNGNTKLQLLIQQLAVVDA